MGRWLAKALYWTYERGSWQWDLACIAILVVIFATPGDFLEGYTRRPLEPLEIRERLLAFLDGFRG